MPAKTNLTENNILKLTKDRPDADSDNQSPTPSICDLNSKQLTSSSPKHHVLHHHFNPHLMCSSNQEKKTNNLANSTVEEEVNEVPPVIDSSDHSNSANLSNNSASVSSSINNSPSQFTNANGTQKRIEKRTCSFSSSPNTRNKMTLKLQVNESENLSSVVYM